MAGIKISALGAVASAQTTDTFPVVQSSVTKKETLAQVLTLFQASITNITGPLSTTFTNSGLHILDTDATHDLIITPGSNLTADRIFTLITGDTARTLDISAASVTVSSFGASLVDDATKLVALNTLGVKRAVTGTYAGGGTSNAFTATGLVSTDIVVATILASTNAVSICKAVPTADTLTVIFSSDPGANTTVQWIAISTV